MKTSKAYDLAQTLFLQVLILQAITPCIKISGLATWNYQRGYSHSHFYGLSETEILHDKEIVWPVTTKRLRNFYNIMDVKVRIVGFDINFNQFDPC